MLYIMYGEDDFSIHESLTALKHEMGDEEALAANTIVLAGGEITPEYLINTCSTIPFLADKRLVIVEGLLGQCQEIMTAGTGAPDTIIFLSAIAIEDEGEELLLFVGIRDILLVV